MARILILGAGNFGSLAAAELAKRGHQSTPMHRPRIDAENEKDVRENAEGFDAILDTAGPFQRRTAAAARAAAALGIPYVDLSDDRAHSTAVAAVEASTPILTGMSTAPALAEALAELARRRDAAGSPAACAMYLGGANKQGPASMAFAVRSRAVGPSVIVDFGPIGKRRAFPSRAYFDGEFFVAVGGISGIGWRFRPLLKLLAPIASKLPRPGFDTAGAVIAFVGDHREGVHLLERGQRIAILPAVWAIEEALAGRAPKRAALPREWVEPPGSSPTSPRTGSGG